MPISKSAFWCTLTAIVTVLYGCNINKLSDHRNNGNNQQPSGGQDNPSKPIDPLPAESLTITSSTQGNTLPPNTKYFYTVTNNSQDTLTINSINLSSSAGDNSFQLLPENKTDDSQDCVQQNTVLQPGQSCEAKAQYTSTSKNQNERTIANLTLTAIDNLSSQTVTLQDNTVTGITPANYFVTATPKNNLKKHNDSNKDNGVIYKEEVVTITVKNTNPQEPVRIDSISLSDTSNYMIQAESTCSIGVTVLVDGDQCQYLIQFLPTQPSRNAKPFPLNIVVDTSFTNTDKLKSNLKLMSTTKISTEVKLVGDFTLNTCPDPSSADSNVTQLPDPSSTDYKNRAQNSANDPSLGWYPFFDYDPTTPKLLDISNLKFRKAYVNSTDTNRVVCEYFNPIIKDYNSIYLTNQKLNQLPLDQLPENWIKSHNKESTMAECVSQRNSVRDCMFPGIQDTRKNSKQ